MAEEFDIDAELIRKLAGLLEETGLGEIEYEAGGARVRVVRPGTGVAPAVAAAAPAQPAAPAPAAATSPEDHPGAVNAPMVGTVYLSPAPGEPPLINVGDNVAAGQPLLQIEAMKTFNEVRAPHAGKVAAIVVESGQPVEYGETLAIIE